MSSDSQDSDGEELSTIRPTLIRELCNVLDLYPDDGQILKELIQNAEDAGASVVKVLTDSRKFNQEVDPRTLRKHPHLKFFQGPALCVYNDAEFSPDDWKGIRMLHTSIKEKDPLKVGRFGLGFKSVFHLTDRLVILSGDHIMYMDPFKGEDHYCKRHLVKNRRSRELQSILMSLDDVFGVCRETFEMTGHFPGTLFWFPLRQSASDLSSTVYTKHNVEDLLGSFKAEASSLLLFLNQIQSVQILAREDHGGPEKIFSVGLASSCLREVHAQRQRFVREITVSSGSLPHNESYCVTEVVMETVDHVNSCEDSRRWLVASYHSGQRQISHTLLSLCSDPQLSYRPYVGVAFPLTDQSSFQSQIFCFLPLPLDTRSPTGLPVHVHGYFALEQNRRHLKWPPADQIGNSAQLDAPSRWNCELVRELLPKVYHRAVLELKRLCPDPQMFYQMWPDVRVVHDRWRPVLLPLYRELVQESVFFCHIHRGQWIPIQQAVLQRVSGQFSEDVKKAVIRVYTISQEKLVKLPDHVHYTLNTLELLKDIQVIRAARVRELIPKVWSNLCRSEKLALLKYLFHSDQKLLLNQKLLPLADGVTFTTFRGRDCSSRTLWCSGDLNHLFPGLEAELCDNSVPPDVRDTLQCLAESGVFSMDCVRRHDPRIPSLLQKSLQTRSTAERPLLPVSDPWIERVWQYLSTCGNIAPFKDVPLIPVKQTGTGQPSNNSEDRVMLFPLSGIYICSSVHGLAPLSSSLASALTKLGIMILDDLPEFVVRHTLGSFVNYPTEEGILKAVSQVNDGTVQKTKAIQTFNGSATEADRTALIRFLSSSRSQHRLPKVLQHLNLFTNAMTKQPTSVDQVSSICPADVPPVPLPAPFLACNSTERTAAKHLGAKETTLFELVRDVMQTMSVTNQYSGPHVMTFMTFFLKNKALMEDSSLLSIARKVQFVLTESGELERAQDLYDPSSPLLKELFGLQRKTLFPCGDFAQANMIKKLKKIGLKSEREVTADDLISTANQVASLLSRNQQSAAKTVGAGLFRYLRIHGDSFSRGALKAISVVQCLPCLQSGETPTDYPTSLLLASSPALVKPAEINSHELLYVTGSARPVLPYKIDERVAKDLQVIREARPEDVLQHLRNVIGCYKQQEASHYKLILNKIFQFFSQSRSSQWIESLRGEKCILVESGEEFASPVNFWIQRKPGDIDLKPYRFPLPVEMKPLSGLMEKCGSPQFQNDEMLHGVLSEICSKHLPVQNMHPDFNTDFSLVKHILDVLVRHQSNNDGRTLLPIVHPAANVLRFMAASECTILSSRNVAEIGDVGFEIYYVHPEITNSTAQALGAKLMRDRALTGVEDLDYGYSQREELTSRLHNLLKEAYTDGFSVPKELIQNADDAHASKVCFLLDERENLNSRSNLIADGMASLQGPAIWVYNDALFSDTDFENIVRLGSGTKKEDATKVGKFGLGFNAVYNLTDVPFFLSGHRLAMFDPQLKYLEKGRGLQLDFTKPVNKALLGRMPEQFQPFQHVFGCTLRGDEDTDYRGTLFRFPLRTAQQAVNNKLKTDSYSELKRREFLRMLLDKAGSLLLFTQSVQEVEVYHLPSHCPDPRDMKTLLTVRKSCTSTVVSPPRLQLGNSTVLQFMKSHWSHDHRDIKLQQRLKIEMEVTTEAKAVCNIDKSNSVTHWQLAWASGVDRSAAMARYQVKEGFLPLAAAAISLSENCLVPLGDSPKGFYNTGHLFCFLPLPEEMVRVRLPVHINGTFAVTSDRRSLLVRTEDDLDRGMSFWNQILFSDPVVRAYLSLLEQVRNEATQDVDFNRYFDLWPTCDMPHVVDSFYQHLQSDHSEVFPVPGQNTWVSFADANFLQPEFRKSAFGKIAWDCLQKFWTGPGYVVDVPDSVCKLMRDKGAPGSFDSRVVTEFVFYRDFFFPNLQNEWWQPDHRDKLVYRALLQNDTDIHRLMKEYPCIPTQCSEQFRKPGELVRPSGPVANLFLKSEGYFPQDGMTNDRGTRMEETSNKVNFCHHESLRQLAYMGMITSELPWEMVQERAESVRLLHADERTREEALNRASYLIEYLSSRRTSSLDCSFENCSPERKEALAHTAFLPVLSKPPDWPYAWAGGLSDSQHLAAPSELFSESLKNLAASSMKLLDTKTLSKSSVNCLPSKMRDVLKVLGLIVDERYDDPHLLHCALMQLIIVAEHHNADPENHREIAQSVSNSIYSYLNTCLRRTEEDSIKENISTHLSSKNVVWTGAVFVQPSQVAFHCQHDCTPYLFQLEKSLQRLNLFWENISLKRRFEADAVLSVMKSLYEENGDTALSADFIKLFSHLAQLLGDIVRSSSESVDSSCVFLPDRHGLLQPSHCLCVDDCEWLRESDDMKFVHGLIAPDIAQLLGVKTKRGQDFDRLTEAIHVEPFGQHEKLTVRIERLLQGYTFDSSLCKELIQNADDAGATEAKFIMDFRHLGTRTVPEKWERLQGPALCFYNNKSFTKADMQGIQSLGVGSKRQDALKIGQFGVGFNAVFHITDVPSFWTREDDEKPVICVLDPNCQYVTNTEPNKPGVKFTDIERLRLAYPDLLSGYLGTAVDTSQSGTLFRFPLRTADMARLSEIQKVPTTETNVQELMETFKEEMSACLLFLNNLEKVGIYTVSKDGALKPEFEVCRTVQDHGSQQLTHFKTHLKIASERQGQKQISVEDIDTFETVVQSVLTDSKGRQEKWLTVHRLGFSQGTELLPKVVKEWSERHLRLLPCGGVAVRLTGAEKKGTQKPANHLAFCTLPLPVETGLPVHVNGHFALDHETRRNLWDSGDQKDDVRSEWNATLALHVIVPAYITALQHVKNVFFPIDELNCGKKVVTSRLNQYNNLFPELGKGKSDIWKKLIQELYQTLARQELSLFPVMSEEQPSLEWLPVVCKESFPGYFSNLVTTFKAQEPSKPVRLSQGGSGNQKTDETRKHAKEMESLLKRLNMKILHMPFHIYTDFKASGVDVQEVTASTVLTFLKSSGQAVKGGCSINSLPQPVINTPLREIDNVGKLLKFVSTDPEFVNSLDGLPLCLRQSGTLHKFSCAEHKHKPIISRFSHLLPGSAEEFLHEKIMSFFNNSDQTQHVLQQLDIPMFASRLKHSVTHPNMGAGKPCILEDGMFPVLPFRGSWFKHLWEFLGTQLKQECMMDRSKPTDSSECLKAAGKSKELKEKPTIQQPILKDSSGQRENLDVKEMREKAREKLQVLQKWCLIPVKKKNASSEKAMLYPIHDLYKVVFEGCDQSNHHLQLILKRLPLPFLDRILYDSIAQKLVASISHPRALLHALASCSDRLSASHADGSTILRYFENNMALLKDSCEDETNLKKELRSLPVFPAIDGKLVTAGGSVSVLCIESSVPEDGLLQWSQQRKNQLLLLRQDFIPSQLIEFLDFQVLAVADFYFQYLLPFISSLPQKDIVTHMEVLREKYFKNVYRFENMEEEQKQLSGQLKITAFIPFHGTLHRAGDFYTPHDEVFKLMCSPDSFPPEPYCDRKWTGLLTAAGIVSDVTDSMFLAFARAVEQESQTGVTEEVASKSRTLVSHLFVRENLTHGNLLSDVKSIRFLLPLNWKNIRDIEDLWKIAPPFSHTGLVSYAESCFEQNLDLVWSSSCIMDSECDPRNFWLGKKQENIIMSQLGLQGKAPKTKVMQHVRNVCNQLGGDRGRDAFDALSSNKRRLIIVMETLYRYLEDNLKREDISVLNQLKIICDLDNKQMLQPANVVVDLRSNEMIKGHIEKAPHQFGRYFDFFKKLGATQNVTANHYAVVLSWLKTQSGNEELNVEELKIAKTAVDGLFRCLREGSDEGQKVEITAVYLPTEAKTLQKSTELILKDTYLGTRFRNPPEGKHFFLGFDQLKIKVNVEADEISRLPEQHKMALLSKVVKEVISDETHEDEQDADCSHPLVARLEHPMTKEALVRLAYHEYKCHNRMFTEETARQIVQELMNVSVKTTYSLKTHLTVYNNPVPGTEKSKHSFVMKIQEDSRMAVVYVADDSARKWSQNEDECVHSLAIAIQFVLHSYPDSHLLHQVLFKPDKARAILNRAEIAYYTYSNMSEETVFPPAGDFIPVRFHHHLNNSFFDFDKGEHVGYEVHDPEIDDGDGDGEAETESSNDVYIYGIILGEVFHQSAENAGRLNRHYRVDLGPVHGRIVVSVLKLYKLVRKRNSQSVLVQSEEDQEREPEEPLDFKAVLREIRSLLTEAWQLPDKRDRRRVVKRLLLQWHPDKNPENIEFCTRVTQAILRYISMLDQGQQLPADDKNEYDASAGFEGFYRSSSSFSSSFFTNMHARGRRHQQHFHQERQRRQRGRSGSRRYGGHKDFDAEPNPQPGESRRWLHQAEADLIAANAAKGTYERGHNWTCFQCHQAVEKALKAVLCLRDVDSFDNMSHDIIYLAKKVKDQDPTLQELVQGLERRIGPHARMCYPDVLVYPRVPADMFTEDDASFAYDTATRILAQIKTLVKK